jgi:hypothetical protein
MHRSPAAYVLICLTLAGCDSGRQTPTAPAQAATPPPAPPPPPGGNATDDRLVGRYTLTLDLGSECGAIPDAARVRRYTATIDPDRQLGYVVTLSDASFLAGLICTFTVTGLGCNQFPASRNGDLVEFDLVNNNDDGHGGHIVEQLSSGTWIEIIGKAAGQLSAQTIEATGSSSVWYCPSPSGYPFPCFSHTGCRSTDTRLTFTRR